jgi:2,5-diketo-D-gluconate reductase A
MTVPSIGLNDGHLLPSLGLGTYGMNGSEGAGQIATAIESGYRLIDTALNYGNVDAVAEAIRRVDVPRDDLVVTTKLPGRHHGYDETLASFRESLGNLGLERVDLYLIHWPLPRVDRFVDSFRAFVTLQEEGLVSSIGVSNFTEAHLQRLADECRPSTRSNCTRTSPRRSCGPCTSAWASSPRAGARWPSRASSSPSAS